MSEVPIVFNVGQNEGIDARVLPNTQHKSVQNVRFRKDGRPQKRPAVTKLSGAGIPAPYATQFVNFVAEYNGSRIVGVGGGVTRYNQATGWLPIPETTASDELSHWMPGERIPVQRVDYFAAASQVQTCSVAALGSLVVNVYANAFPTMFYNTYSATGVPVRPSFLSILGTAPTYPRLLAVNGILYLFFLDGTSLNFTTFNASNYTFSSSITTLQTVTGGGAFDVCAHGSGEFILVWQQSLTALNAARYTAVASPVLTGGTRSITTNSSAQYPSVSCVSNTGSVFIAWLEQTATPSVRFAAYDSTLTTQTGAPANVLSPVAGTWDQPGVLANTATTAVVLAGTRTAGGLSTVTSVAVSSAGAVVTTSLYPSQRLSSKPFGGPNMATYEAASSNSYDDPFAFMHTPELDAWEDQRATWLAHVPPIALANTDKYLATRQLYIPSAQGAGTITSGTPQANLHLDDVVNGGAGLGYITSTRVQLRGYSSLNLSTAQNFGVDQITFHSIFESQFYAARDTAVAGRVLQISGGALQEMNGAVQETGIGATPVIISLTGIPGGGMTVSSSYLYKVVYEAIDAQGRRVRSATSDPASVTLTAAQGSVNVLFSTPASVGRNDSTGGVALSAHVYRSLAGQTTYHRVTGPNGVISGLQASTASLLDSLFDSAAAGAEFIYTDGGVLDNGPAPSCTFMCVCNGRLWLGGQFERTRITASKTLVDGEPTQFSAFSAFNVTLPQKCTGLASIDGTVVAFAANAIYLVTGEGPNNQGVGSFNPPTALPTDVGCIDWRSVVETSLGVFFQSQRGIFLLPRGFNVPTFVGAPVEDTLRAYPTVTSATLVAPSNGDELTVRFTVTDSGGVNPGATLVYNLRTGGWIVDTTQTGELVGPGGTWLGQWVQTTTTSGLTLANIYEEPAVAAYAEGGGNAFVPSVLATGNVRPFGVAGYGNFESVLVMGEYRGNSNVVVSVSVDGVAADTYTFAVTSADAPDGVVYLDATPRIRKGASISVTVQDAAIGGVATEGFITQAVYLEVEPMKGGKRLAVARRA